MGYDLIMSFRKSQRLCILFAFMNLFFVWFNKSNVNLVIALAMIWYVFMVEISGVADEV